MITEPTVLILGAGASADYGFPTGRTLMLQICQQTQVGSGLFQFLTERFGYPEGDLERFSKALQFSGAQSVDLFLEHRKEFEDIGKVAIAATLIPYEDYQALGISPMEPRWYEILFGLMAEGGKFEDNQLSIITFNYERSLEAFLFQALKNLYGLEDDKADDLLRKIQIVHLYGSLSGGLISRGGQRGYSTECRGDWVIESAKRIKIVHEAEPDTPEFGQAHQLLKGAAEIIFLGFGFHPRNIERLKLHESVGFYAQVNRRDQRFLACRTHMGEGDIIRARNYLPGGVKFAPDPAWKIRDFLSNTQCLNTFEPPQQPPPQRVKVVT